MTALAIAFFCFFFLDVRALQEGETGAGGGRGGGGGGHGGGGGLRGVRAAAGHGGAAGGGAARAGGGKAVGPVLQAERARVFQGPALPRCRVPRAAPRARAPTGAGGGVRRREPLLPPRRGKPGARAALLRLLSEGRGARGAARTRGGPHGSCASLRVRPHLNCRSADSRGGGGGGGGGPPRAPHPCPATSGPGPSTL